MPDLSSINSAVQDIAGGGIFRIFDSGIFSSIYFWFKVIFFFAVAIFGCVFVYKTYFKYNIKITLHKDIGSGGNEVKYDKAKIEIDSQNKRKFVLFKTRQGDGKKITCPVPESQYKGKLGKADHYHLFIDDNCNLHPIIPPSATDAKIQIVPQERNAWSRLEEEELQRKYKERNLLLQYLPYISLMVVCVTAFLIFFFAAKELGAGMSNLAATFQQIAASCTKMGG